MVAGGLSMQLPYKVFQDWEIWEFPSIRIKIFAILNPRHTHAKEATAPG